MRRKLEKVVVPELDRLVAVYNAIADAVAESSSVEELRGRLVELSSHVPPILRAGWSGFLNDLNTLVEVYDDPENGPTLMGANNVFWEFLRLAGYPTWKLGRAVAVAVRAEVWHRVMGHFYEEPAVAVVVFADPDSGVRDYDVIAVTGFRFGADEVIKDGRTLAEVHGDRLDKLAGYINALRFNLHAIARDKGADVGELDACLQRLQAFFEEHLGGGEGGE